MSLFNPDGSIKLPDRLAKAKKQNEFKFNHTPCIKIEKEVVNMYAPKKCKLTITLSPKMQRNDFVQNIYRFFNWKAETPNKMTKINEKEFHVELGSNFRRCSDCTTLINRYREYNDGNIIVKKGNCTYQPRQMSYEDHFD